MSEVSIAGGAVRGKSIATKVAVTPGATPAIDASLGTIFTLTPGEDENLSVSNFVDGESMVLVVLTSGTTSRTLTFGAGFKTTGTLATGAVTAKTFVIRFTAANGVMNEESRTPAM